MSTGSLKKAFTLIAGTLCGLSVGYGFRHFISATPQRLTASQGEASSWNPAEVEKHLAPVRVQILAPQGLPANDEQEVQLDGYVTLNQEASADLEYQWILPPGASLVEGSLSDGWSGVQRGQTAVTRLRLIGFSRAENKIITLEAHSRFGARRIGNTAVMASRPEDTMESIAPAKMRARQKFNQENAGDL